MRFVLPLLMITLTTACGAGGQDTASEPFPARTPEPTSSPTPTTFSARGSVQVYAVDGSTEGLQIDGLECQGASLLSNFREGAQAILTDSTPEGPTVGVVDLGKGLVRKDGDRTYCEWNLFFRGLPTDVEFFSMDVAGHGSLRYSADEVRAGRLGYQVNEDQG